MIIIIDNYDSFTFNIAHSAGICGFNTSIIRNDKYSAENILNSKPSGIILSPGPCDPHKSGICLDLVKLTNGKVPILGVCLGHQTIASAFGSKIIRAPKPVHGKVCDIYHTGKSPIFDGIPQKISVTRYHSLIIERESICNDFTIDAISNEEEDKGLVMSISHNKYPYYGVQFHPESIRSQYGQKIIDNFIRIVKDYSNVLS